MIPKAALSITKILISTVWANDVPSRPAEWDEKNPGHAELADLEYVFHRIISALFFAGGFVAFAYLIIGGFKYLTSSGDEDAMESAKKTVTFAVLGLLIITFSWLFLNVLGKTLGIEDKILQFTIPGT